MIDFAGIKEKVKNRPAISKADFNTIINNIENQYKQIMTDDGRVANLGKVYRPVEVARYDIITTFICGTIHPAMVFKTDNDFVYSVTFSSTEGDHCLYTFQKSRMFKGKFMSNTIIKTKKADALTLFVGIFDNKAEADVALNRLKDLYKNIFKL